MHQILGKYVVLTVCAVLALCFALRPAHAQTTLDLNAPGVFPGGTGEHLLFAYWSTANYTNTNVSIHSPLGMRTSGETKNVVRVVIRDDMGEKASDFKICLTPGDSWAATLSSAGLMVADPGECDDVVQQTAPDRENLPVPTPMMGEMVSLGDAESGYLEAWLAPNKGLVDDTVPCGAPADPADPQAGECATAEGVGGGDADLVADNASGRSISGKAMLVSPMSGFSSSYKATALYSCGTLTTDIEDDGCRTVADIDGTDGETVDDDNGIMHALRSLGQVKHLLVGRWTAIADENVTSHTKVVLTFAGGNHLNYAGKMGAHAADADASILAAIAEVEGTDPVSIVAFDDTGRIVLSDHEVELGQVVNTCRFMQPMGDDMDMMDMPMLACNDEMVGALDGMSGEFRIFNNVMDNVALPDATTAGQYNLTGAFSDGTELTGIGAHNAAGALVDSDPDTAGDQIPQMPAESLALVGLVFSYFEGTDGNQYDQVTPIDWIDLDTDGAAGTADIGDFL